jgi:shikimate kinase
MEKPLTPPLTLLTGPKHAGKTSVGRALAALWGGDITDLDELVEEQTGKSPRTLFTEGPEIFRKAEAAALESFLRDDGAGEGRPPGRIAAAGGGLADNPGALELLRGAPPPWIVYLEVSPETAWERIVRSQAAGGGLPPFLNTADPRGTHFTLHTRRAESYRHLAHQVVPAEGQSPAQIAARIAGAWTGKA